MKVGLRRGEAQARRRPSRPAGSRLPLLLLSEESSRALLPATSIHLHPLDLHRPATAPSSTRPASSNPQPHQLPTQPRWPARPLLALSSAQCALLAPPAAAVPANSSASAQSAVKVSCVSPSRSSPTSSRSTSSDPSPLLPPRLTTRTCLPDRRSSGRPTRSCAAATPTSSTSRPSPTTSSPWCAPTSTAAL